MSRPARRTGAETKAEAERVALSLFIAQGYAATSLRQIADELGINKASLYYHFKNKEAIVTSVMVNRANEAEELLTWARAQRPSPDLLDRVVLRWVGTLSVDKLRGIRFLNANPAMVRTIATGSAHRIRESLGALVEMFAGDPRDPIRVLLVRMAFLSINAAVSAASATSTDDDIAAGAREAALAILARLHSREPSPGHQMR